ncbi:MAG TPA: tRNA (adenosine(37)-N6)-dimethylallyltransferase MiaA [Candidatus Vogelbacteria bacterium]|nr:tRNA (adenosine(37)-N6)-dimethylallyltransferase MiaA [Candidatus Vogelbacteria bacterium]
MNKEQKIIVIAGPTSSGKSSLAVELAKKFNGEIISADSRQVYKGFDLSSGKVNKKEMKNIKHYLLDVISPKKNFSVNDYVSLADKAIKEISEKNKLPFIVGGSGFYIKALLGEMVFPEVPPDNKRRIELEKKTTKELYLLLEKLDKKRAKDIDKNNRRRLIRAIEIAEKLGQVPEIKTEKKYDCLKIAISLPVTELEEKIETRLKQRIKQGMIKEITNLHKKGLSWKRLESFGLEFKAIALYLQKKTTKEEMINNLKKEIRQYAKRQLTWFKKDKEINWLKNQKEAEKLIQEFLNQP